MIPQRIRPRYRAIDKPMRRIPLADLRRPPDRYPPPSQPVTNQRPCLQRRRRFHHPKVEPWWRDHCRFSGREKNEYTSSSVLGSHCSRFSEYVCIFVQPRTSHVHDTTSILSALSEKPWKAKTDSKRPRDAHFQGIDIRGKVCQNLTLQCRSGISKRRPSSSSVAWSFSCF